MMSERLIRDDLQSSSPTPHRLRTMLSWACRIIHALLLMLGLSGAVTLGIAGLRELQPAATGTPVTVTE